MENNNKINPAVGGVKNKNVETYAEDMAKALEEGGGGVIKQMIREQEAEEAEKKNLSPESKKNQLFLFTSIALVFLAALAIVFIFLNRQDSTVSVIPQFSPIIFTDKSQFIEVTGLSKDKVAQTVRNEVAAVDVKSGGVEGIYLTENKAVLGLRKFLNLIKANLDQSKIAFINDNFLLGAFSKDTKDFFILLKVRSVADIFEPMQAWENKMFEDLHGFFGVNITQDTNYLLTKDFGDGIIQNKNARILYDNSGRTVLMYVFADDTSVIIANTEESVNEVILRLSSSQIKK